MKAVAAKEGKVILTDLPLGSIPSGHIRIRTEYSAISPGTEMTIVKRSGPEPFVLGYSAVGVVEQLGENTSGIQIGQRVACYGSPYVRHAEVLTVPSNLVALVPEHVPPEEAAFAGLGAIAIHALRTADLRFGESAIVWGLGVLGNLVAQIASAASLRTAGMDWNPERVHLLKENGLTHAYDNPGELEKHLADIAGEAGADSVFLCVGGSGEDIINRSLSWVRDRGSVVVVGDIGTTLTRANMFRKEAKLLISRAGGPGRYDAQYELENYDYPIGYVRWTEGRNVQEYVRLLANQRISVSPLITHIYPLREFEAAYSNYLDNMSRGVMGTLIRYE